MTKNPAALKFVSIFCSAIPKILPPLPEHADALFKLLIFEMMAGEGRRCLLTMIDIIYHIFSSPLGYK